ncbi:YceI family protein [Hymenobacter busanensis]|uniref:YceI family protein n=1 Tax=Hymenobacter busanensis TaxID=2607656 RepID=A0A7L5A0S0_9BACT|nr:YceI family protein [Hymenobacter busanensis]KAA9338196.1 YceI family protein [Hymenobacter busanensis]QHJ09379.1 hypothetical protein GUY19_19660 [Hymenobacter busanensis]
MKTAFVRLLMLFVLTSAAGFAPALQVYHVVPGAAQLTWTGHAEVGTWAPTGTLQLRQARLEIADNAVRGGFVEFDMRTLAHTNDDLQTHLRGADFFDVARFPTATFRVREVANGTARGQLTLKGITLPLAFPVEVVRTPAGLRISGTATVDRTAYGVTYNSSGFFQNLGDHAIRNDFQLAFVLLATPQSPAARLARRGPSGAKPGN